MTTLPRTAVVAAAIVAFEALLAAGAAAQEPAEVVGPEECLECHEAAYDVWEETEHQASFRTFHRADSTRAILERLGERSARRAVCTDCHYTEAEQRGRTRAIAGVSCESCHGGAADWVDVHNNYGVDAQGERATRETETAEHRQERLRRTAEAGMIRPDMPYELVENCYQCHTAPREELVNTGGHHAGSDFDIVERLDRIRHNFQLSEGETNRAAAREYDPRSRNRLLYVLGQMVNLEHALRGLATASAEGRYSEAMARRATEAKRSLQAIADASDAAAPAVNETLAAVDGLSLAPGQGDALVAAADQVESVARGFADSHDGSGLAGVDALMEAGG